MTCSVRESQAEAATEPERSATAWRDLDALAEPQRVIRPHGGASTSRDASVLPRHYQAVRAAATAAIASCAAGRARTGSEEASPR